MSLTPADTADRMLAALALYEAAERGDQQGWDALNNPDAVVGLFCVIHTLLQALSAATQIPLPLQIAVIRTSLQAAAVTE